MSSIKVIDSSEARPQKRKSPAQIIIESLGNDYKTMRMMAERYDVNVETIRRLCKAVDADGQPRVKAPSKAVQQGNLTIYLFDADDVAEIDEYMNKKGYEVVEL